MAIKTFPFRKIFNPQTGKTTMVSGQESINNCLAMLLSSCKGELLGDPNFGTDVKKYLLNFKGGALYVTLRKTISDAITRYEKRVLVNNDDIYISQGADENTLNIRVVYKDLTDGTTKTLTLTLNGDEL